jgi:hypothetical protein
MKRQIFPITVSAGGAFDNTTTKQMAILGKLYSIEYRPGTLDTGATVTVTCEGDASKPLLTKATAGTSNLWFYPRDIVHAVADGAVLTGTAGGDRCQPILNGWIKVVIASGGVSMSGSLVVYYEE